MEENTWEDLVREAYEDGREDGFDSGFDEGCVSAYADGCEDTERDCIETVKKVCEMECSKKDGKTRPGTVCELEGCLVGKALEYLKDKVRTR